MPTSDPQSTKQNRGPLTYVLTGLLIAITLACVYIAWRANSKAVQYAAPDPAAYSPDNKTSGSDDEKLFSDDDFVTPPDPRATEVQLEERVERITRRIAELKQQNRHDEAADVQIRLDRIRANQQGPYEHDGQTQLHYVALHRGFVTKEVKESGERDPLGEARVHVTYTGAPIVLCLAAYGPVKWQLDVDSEVKLEKIVLGGYFQQQLEGAPPGVPIEGQVSEDRQPEYVFYKFEREGESGAVAAQLEALTELPLSSFQGAARYDNTPFVIGPENPEWAAQMTVHSIEPLYREAMRERHHKLAAELARHTFPELHVTPADEYGGVETSFATFTIFGPYIDSMQPLERGVIRFAFVDQPPAFFTWHDELLSIDAEHGTLSAWPAEGLEDVGNRVWIGYDSKRKRLLLWDKDLYAVDLLTKTAELVRKGNPDVRGFCYSPADDRIYAACAPRGGSSHVTISRWNSFNYLGAELTSHPLSIPIPNARYDRAVKLIPVGKKVALMPMLVRNEDSGVTNSELTYFVEPSTGEVEFVCKRKPR